mmetsp:Transcript_41261/g.86612  ORF Transcript_41261/g.86612 Transcript_41261/m.86612 type:complete len:204 (+) Transcript_41261:430-1041(+)
MRTQTKFRGSIRHVHINQRYKHIDGITRLVHLFVQMHPVLMIHLRFTSGQREKAPLVHQRRILSQNFAHNGHPRRPFDIREEGKGLCVKVIEFHVKPTPSAFAQDVESILELLVEGARIDGVHDFFVVIDAGRKALVDLRLGETVVGGGGEGWRWSGALGGAFCKDVCFGFCGGVRFCRRDNCFCIIVIAGRCSGSSGSRFGV